MLNSQQKTCLESLSKFVESDRKLYLVNGEAGSGKTYLIKEFVKHILANKTITISATTNKACGILEPLIDNCLIPIETIHKTLGLTMKQVEEKQIISKNPNSFSRLEEFNVCIVDEGSMIDSRLFTMIQNKLYSILGQESKVIFFADEGQIQPVGETKSPIFGIKHRSDLTEVVRQAKNSPLMPLIQATRQLALGSKRIKFDEFLIDNWKNNEGVRIYPYEQWMSQIIKSFSSKNYQENPFTHSKIIGWRNRVVEELALKVRSHIEKTNIPYESGDLIYVKEAVKHPYDENVIVIQNCTELQILEATPFDYSINGKRLKAWELKVWKATDENYTSNYINAIDPAYQGIFNALMFEMIENAKAWKRSHPKGDSSKLWREFYKHKFNFAEINHIHSITVRRSQGSEWDNCFVWLPDLIASKDWAHLYTAFTRTKKRLIIGV